MFYVLKSKENIENMFDFQFFTVKKNTKNIKSKFEMDASIN